MHKKYIPENIEKILYDEWEQAGYFQPNNNTNKKNYCIIMPPPNITGTLHLGHAFQHTIMDILIRYQRMREKNTLWLPGTDHAGIATQILVERYITEHENKNRNDYERKTFLKKIWIWKEKHTDIIRKQMKRLGISVNWKQERFTLDSKISFAVKEAFIQLYKENLIYRGQRLINWDPKIQTAISDLEIKTKKTNGNMWYLRYLLSNNKKTMNGLNYLIIATTRPETIFGDVAIAIHPNDQRYQNLFGHYVHIPITHRKIPIIFDTYVDMTKGTGCMKITPGHDFNDYTIAKKHHLPIINIFSLDGNIKNQQEIFNNNNIKITNTKNYIPKSFHNVNRFLARKIVIKKCEMLNLLDAIQNHKVTMLYNNRNGEPIEPMLTNQWYIRTKPLSKKAIEAVKNGHIQFIQEQYKNMYFKWMNNLEDWCISRQLWWGHRIPAWYDNKNTIYVGHNEEEIRKNNKLDNSVILHQDEDVLDTWFSSSLWTFASLGWPKDIETLQRFHPTNVIVTGFDIIFFWIARMIMLTTHLIKNKNNQPEIPFKKIYITGLILDEIGQKMSKSKGNIIDPLDIIEGISIENLLKKRTSNMMRPELSNIIITNTKKKFPNGIQAYGTDSLRFTLTALASTGRNIHWDMRRLSGYYSFCNKLWNAGQYVLIHTKNIKYKELLNNKEKILSTSDRWILTIFQNTIQTFSEALNNYRFDQAANVLYTFIWNQFCNWYIEFAKASIQNENKYIVNGTYYGLLTVLEQLLRLAHPVIPFITEAIWQQIKHIFGHNKTSIMIQPFPQFEKSLIDINAVNDIEWIKKVIINIRNIRNEANITIRTPLTIIFQNISQKIKKRIKKNEDLLITTGNINNIIFSNTSPKNEKNKELFAIHIEDVKILIPITKRKENKTIQLNRITKELKNIKKEILYTTNKINNENFIHYAPLTIITKEKNKLKNLKKIKQELLKKRNTLDEY